MVWWVLVRFSFVWFFEECCCGLFRCAQIELKQSIANSLDKSFASTPSLRKSFLAHGFAYGFASSYHTYLVSGCPYCHYCCVCRCY